MSSKTNESPAPDAPPDDASEPEREDEDEDEEGAAETAPAPAKAAAATPWADRWWVWALGGLAFAALIGLLQLTAR